jgi:hypothetical protein
MILGEGTRKMVSLLLTGGGFCKSYSCLLDLLRRIAQMDRMVEDVEKDDEDTESRACSCEDSIKGEEIHRSNKILRSI